MKAFFSMSISGIFFGKDGDTNDEGQTTICGMVGTGLIIYTREKGLLGIWPLLLRRDSMLYASPAAPSLIAADRWSCVTIERPVRCIPKLIVASCRLGAGDWAYGKLASFADLHQWIEAAIEK